MPLDDLIVYVRNNFDKIPYTRDILKRVNLLLDSADKMRESFVQIPEKFNALLGVKNVGFVLTEYVGFIQDRRRTIISRDGDISLLEGDDVTDAEATYFYNKYPFFEQEFYNWFFEEFGN